MNKNTDVIITKCSYHTLYVHIKKIVSASPVHVRSIDSSLKVGTREIAADAVRGTDVATAKPRQSTVKGRKPGDECVYFYSVDGFSVFILL